MPYLQIEGKQIQHVSEFKILGLKVSNNLHWDCNIKSYATECHPKLYFCKLLKQAVHQ